MARIRTIKPEFWIDEELTSCGPWARLLFIALWNFADDQGYIEDKPRRIKAQAFPNDDIDVEPIIDELVERGRLVRYDSPIGPVLHIKNWTRHQKVDRASTPRFDEDSLRPREASRPATPKREVAPASLDAEGKGSGSGRDLDLEGKGSTRAGARTGARGPTTRADAEFAAFWETYPRREAKAAARKAWDKATRTVDPERILAGARRYRDDPHRDPPFTKHASTWLNQACWDDDPLPARASPNGQRAGPGGLVINERTAKNLDRHARMAALDAAAGQPPPIGGPT